MRRFLILGASHVSALAVGFALGVYFLPILTAPDSPDSAMLQSEARDAMFVGELTRDLRGSDFLHWGEGKISVTPTRIVHEGTLAPGPDYKLYLTQEFVEHEDEFESVKAQAQLIGDIKPSMDLCLQCLRVSILRTTRLLWCEAFGEFITATKYR